MLPLITPKASIYHNECGANCMKLIAIFKKHESSNFTYLCTFMECDRTTGWPEKEIDFLNLSREMDRFLD